MAHIFISYARGDIEFVRYLRLLLEKAGFRVWVDERGIDPSDDWWETIEQNIIGCAALLVVMSPRALESRWIKRELLLAEDQQKPLFPVLLEGKVWSRLADIQAIDMSAGLRAPLPETFVTRLREIFPGETPRGIEFTVVEGDVLTVEADVLAMKHAQKFRGADETVAQQLLSRRTTIAERATLEKQLSPSDGEYGLVESGGAIAARYVLYVGTPGLSQLKNYLSIRDFGANVLRILAKEAPQTRHLAMTIHGPGFGLDEVEALRYQLLGYTNAILEGTIPPALERITIVERSPGRVQRLREALDEDFKGRRRSASEWGYIIGRPNLTQETKPASKPKAIAPDTKPHAYVIMPDTPDSDDLFYYGIQGAVHAAGLLCERLEDASLSADTLAQIKDRIETATVVIAEMSDHAPAVFLQVGYAWGKERPTILLAKDDTPLAFDLPCVTYKRIKELETGLASQLREMLNNRART
ncbi:MAG: toll/interleukin-1 receptor domain-containing protein [Anaerolineae bacterium]